MAYELIITEKPSASKRIAEALADDGVKKHSENGVPYYEVRHKGHEIVVACAVGHLYTLAEAKPNGYIYPIFDVEWKPSHLVAEESKFSKKYNDVIKKLCKNADSYTIATDYDIEGEVIGYNIIRFTCGKKDAARMKFSTLTKPELVEAYEHKSHHLNWGQANAGLARHTMDYYYGINLSRALTQAIKSVGKFRVMSIGRVQGPALKIIVDREKEIRAFKPVPFWQVELTGMTSDSSRIDAWHMKDKFWDKKEADKVIENVKGKKEGNVIAVEKSQFSQPAPFPFDLTTLQTECYRVHRISPKETLAIAQELYVSGLISYPRTSSQKLPYSLGYKKILENLAKNKDYAVLCSELLKKELRPNEGKKTDPAHPAIFPTGVSAKVDGRQKRVYDLIVKRFMATFAEAAVRETVRVDIDVNKEIFIARGTRTIKEGWHKFYQPYVTFKEEELPKIERGEKINVKQIKLHSKETQPPKRYTPASIIKELEKRGIGTKSTRAQIIDTLFQRGYADGKAIEATEFGIGVVDALSEHSPTILDEALTRHFEIGMEEIREDKKKGEEVLEEAKDTLIKILGEFKEKEKEVGESLSKASLEAMKKAAAVGSCMKCGKGELQIRRGKFGRFIACSNYPACKTTFSLPAGMIKGTDKRCKECDFPVISVIKKGKRPQEVCINQDCPSKKVDESKLKERACPKCKKGKLVVKKSIYGSFLACDKYPECRYTERIGTALKSAHS